MNKNAVVLHFADIHVSFRTTPKKNTNTRQNKTDNELQEAHLLISCKDNSEEQTTFEAKCNRPVELS